MRAMLSLTAALISPFALAWCPDRPTVAQEFKDSRYVFVGQVEKSRDVMERGSFTAGTYYSLRVTENLKGNPSLRMQVFSVNTTDRFPMVVGGSYMVFVDNEYFEAIRTREFSINSCGNSATIKESAKVLAKVRALSDSAEHYFRFAPIMSEAEVRSMADTAAIKDRRDLKRYQKPDIEFDDRLREWRVFYHGVVPAPGNHFMIVIGDRTKSLVLHPGE